MVTQQEKSKPENELCNAILSRLKDAYGDKAERFIPLINSVKKLEGANSIFKDALKFNDSRIKDFIIELSFALYFYEANFIVVFVPRSDKEKTPDLFISNSEFHGFVEIKHIHKKHDGLKMVLPNESDSSVEFEKYGDPIRDERYCRDKILEGFQQIQNFSGLKKTDFMVVAIWNSDADLEDIDMELCINHLIEEKNEFANIPNPKCIVYGSDWHSIRKKTQFHVFNFKFDIVP